MRNVPGLGAWLRATAVLLALFAGVFGLLLRAAKAQIGEDLSRFGGELLSVAEASAHGEARELSVNGLTLHVLSVTTPRSLGETLDRLQALCARKGGLEKPSSVALPALDGALSFRSATQGIVACIDTGRPLGLGELVPRLEQLGRTGDLSSLGELRYFLARRSGARTTVLALWSEGKLPFVAAFPREGDAPGRDPDDIPRPEHGRRLLSAAEHGMPYALTSYAAPETDPRVLSSWYERTLGAQGWAVSRVATGLLARRGERTVLLHTRATSAGSVAAVIELSRAD